MTTEPSPRTAALLAWYRRHRRTLPWRDTADPYRILVSEVMLQQTQAARVEPHYRAFLERFPTAAQLAAASPAEVLAAWSGLGYNRRALRLREAAARVVEEGWPASVEGLRTLPGVGPYTAAAVACFAFGVPVAAIDTNVRRVLSRWEGRPLRKADLVARAARELPAGRAADWNQAVMDLGATTCRPRNPDCGGCPVATWCSGPDVYRPPPRQARFEGSRRQARGAVVRALVEASPADLTRLAERTGLPTRRISDVLDGLEREGLVERAGGAFRLPAWRS